MAEPKYEFDDTRSAIGANDMDSAERKEMLERFKAVGGQVLKEKDITQKAEAGRGGSGKEDGRSGGGRGVGGGSGNEAKLPSELRREREREEADKVQRAKAEYERALKKISGPGARFMVKLRCMLAGVAPFSGRSIKPAF